MSIRRARAASTNVSTLAFAVSLALACTAAPARASDLDTEHLFGFTEGSDIGSRGERELELELGGRTGRSAGAYRVLDAAAALKLTLGEHFRIAPAIAFDRFRISGVPGLDDGNHRAAPSAVAFEMKFRLLDRRRDGTGLTMALTPHWGRVDEVSGQRLDTQGIAIEALLDRELVPGRVLAALNLGYGGGRARVPGGGDWSHDSRVAVSAAVSARVAERVFAGVELVYDRAYDGIALSGFTGWGLYGGPSLYARLSETSWLSAAWNSKLAGRSGDASFTLADVARNLFVLRLGVGF
jgi:hypothetical protein